MRQEVGSSRLEAGDWKLVAGSCRLKLKAGGWRVEAADWRLEAAKAARKPIEINGDIPRDLGAPVWVVWASQGI